MSLEPGTFCVGVLALAVHKRLQTVEIGHSALHGAWDLRELVIRVADSPTDANRAAFRQALPSATLFVKLVGVPDHVAPGEKYVVPKGGVRMRNARLPNGMQMVYGSAAPPRNVAPDEVVATMTGLELLRMVMQVPAQGLLVAAEDERDSWTAMTREGIADMLKGSAAH